MKPVTFSTRVFVGALGFALLMFAGLIIADHVAIEPRGERADIAEVMQ